MNDLNILTLHNRGSNALHVDVEDLDGPEVIYPGDYRNVQLLEGENELKQIKVTVTAVNKEGIQ